MKIRKVLVLALAILLLVYIPAMPASAGEVFDSYIGVWGNTLYEPIEILTTPYEIQKIAYEYGSLPSGMTVTAAGDRMYVSGIASTGGNYEIAYRVYFNNYEYDLSVLHLGVSMPPALTAPVIYDINGAGSHPANDVATISVSCSDDSPYTHNYYWYRSLTPSYPSIKAIDITTVPQIDVLEEAGTYYYCVGVTTVDFEGNESEIIYSDFVQVTWFPELIGPLYYWIPLNPNTSYSFNLIDNYPDEIIGLSLVEGSLPAETTVTAIDHCLYLDTTGIPEGTYSTKWELSLAHMGYYDITLELHVGSGVSIPIVTGIEGGGTFQPGETCTLTANASIASGDIVYVWYGGSSMSYSSMTELARGVGMTTYQPEEALGTRYFCFGAVENSIAGTSEEGLYSVFSGFAEVTWKKSDAGTPSSGTVSSGSTSGSSPAPSSGKPGGFPALPSGSGVSPSPDGTVQGGTSEGNWGMVSIVTPTPAARSGRGPTSGTRDSGEPNIVLILLLVFLGLVLVGIIIVVILLLRKRQQ